jgi:type II secretory pathway pseudopilin PulG
VKKRGESGFALLLVFLMAATIAVTLYMQLPRVAFQSQRQKEQLLIERGEQYQRAIELFFRANQRYPGRIEDLENFNNRRFLRGRYKDPITGKEEWRLIHVNAAGVFTDSVQNKKKPGDDKQGSSSEGQYVGVMPGLGEALPGQPNAANPAQRRRASEGGAPGAGLGPDGQPVQVQTTGIAPMPGQPFAGSPNNPGQMPVYPVGQNNPGGQQQPFNPGAANQQPGPGPAQYLAQPDPRTTVPPEVPNFPGAGNLPGQPIQGRLPFPNPAQPGLPQPGFPPQGFPQQGIQQQGLPQGIQQPGFPQGQQQGFPQGIQQPGFPQGAQQPGGSQSSVGSQPYVGGGGSSVGSQPYVGGSSSVGAQPNVPGLNPANPNPIPPPIQNYGQMPPGFPQPVGGQQNLPQQNFPQQNFPQQNFPQQNFPQQNFPQQNYPQPANPPTPFPGQGAGMNPGAQNQATQMIQNILTTPRQGGLSGAQPVGQQLGGGIAGVASTSEDPSIMTYNDHQNYNEWEFIFDPAKQHPLPNINGGGVVGTPAAQMGTPAAPGIGGAIGPGMAGGIGAGVGAGIGAGIGAGVGSGVAQGIGARPGLPGGLGANPAPGGNAVPGQNPLGGAQGQQQPLPTNLRMGRP